MTIQSARENPIDRALRLQERARELHKGATVIPADDPHLAAIRRAVEEATADWAERGVEALLAPESQE